VNLFQLEGPCIDRFMWGFYRQCYRIKFVATCEDKPVSIVSVLVVVVLLLLPPIEAPSAAANAFFQVLAVLLFLEKRAKTAISISLMGSTTIVSRCKIHVIHLVVLLTL
jgi:hypothetical protein